MAFKRQYSNDERIINVYECDSCKCELSEAWPRIDIDSFNYCYECAFKKGLITEVYYCQHSGGISADMFAAGINPSTGEIELTFGTIEKLRKGGKQFYKRTKRSKFSWEMKDKDYRATKKYQKWRAGVFKRDDYTCQGCGQRGGQLEAHHLKTFNSCVELRYEITNGITLCRHCHMKRHKK